MSRWDSGETAAGEIPAAVSAVGAMVALTRIYL
jgi:hypothetical protein